MVALAAVALTAAGCSSSGDGGATSSAPSPSTAPTPTSSTPSSTPTTSTAPSSSPNTTRSTSQPGTTSAAPSSSSASPSPPANVFETTCTKLITRVIPGGAIRGAEIAGVQYENASGSSCTITGVPTAQLRKGGRDVGPRSQPTGARVTPYTLEPGAVGESLLQDFSSCNAPLSDQVRVTVPARSGGTPGTVLRPIQLRACTLRLAPVGPQG